VVNTHWHGDHVYGNVAYREAWPQARFYATSATLEGMRGPGAATAGLGPRSGRDADPLAAGDTQAVPDRGLRTGPAGTWQVFWPWLCND